MQNLVTHFTSKVICYLAEAVYPEWRTDTVGTVSLEEREVKCFAWGQHGVGEISRFSGVVILGSLTTSSINDPGLTVTWSRSDMELCVVIRAERDRNSVSSDSRVISSDGVIGHPGLCGSFRGWRVPRRPGGGTLIKSCRAGFNDTLVSGRPAPRGSWEMDALSGVRGDWALHTARVYILSFTSQS